VRPLKDIPICYYLVVIVIYNGFGNITSVQACFHVELLHKFILRST